MSTLKKVTFFIYALYFVCLSKKIVYNGFIKFF